VPYVDLADARLYYRDEGRGEPLVFLHAYSRTGERFAAEIAPALVGRYRVVVPDLRGHGRSTGPPETLHHARFGADLIALLDHLDLERAHAVGQSTGAMSLLFAATAHPERLRTLTLSGSTYTWDEPARALMRRWAADWEANPAIAADLRQLHGATHGDDYWRVLVGTFRAWADDPAELPFAPADLAAITCPTLVLHGDRDPIIPVRVPTAMYQAIPDAELAILPGVGHGPPGERPDLFVRILLDFLTRRGPAPP
jgi:pimeloyl-ACP methyl ester carboxylesterase